MTATPAAPGTALAVRADALAAAACELHDTVTASASDEWTDVVLDDVVGALEMATGALAAVRPEAGEALDAIARLRALIVPGSALESARTDDEPLAPRELGGGRRQLGDGPDEQQQETRDEPVPPARRSTARPRGLGDGHRVTNLPHTAGTRHMPRRAPAWLK